MSDRVERKRLLLMKILRESGSPLSSHKIQEQLVSRGMDISERTVRFHLQALDSQGFTGYKEKKGRYLTLKGVQELSKAHVYDRVGFLSAKIDEMTYQMNFNPDTAEGSVLINLSLVEKSQCEAVAVLVPKVFKAGFAHGTMIALFDEGEVIGEKIIPKGMIGIGTVCSITLNGALIKAGVPVTSIFGGLLEIHDKAPDRFTAIIKYEGTSLDPLEIYITSRMTSTGNAASAGNGQIGASFREIPTTAKDKVVETDAKLKKRGLGGFLEMGYPGQSLLDIPVGDGRVGMVVTGGLNAVAPLVEEGIPLESKALSAFIEYSKLFPYGDLPFRISRLK